MSTDNALTDFKRQETNQKTLELQFNRWSRLMIRLLIGEQEAKMQAGDLPVESAQDDFWAGMA